jgi:hypothetical protein
MTYVIKIPEIRPPWQDRYWRFGMKIKGALANVIFRVSVKSLEIYTSWMPA